MKLLLARHGNTFSPGDRVFWVGSKNDIPLVEEGFRQADRLADILLASGIRLARIYCGPLQRTKEYAQHILYRLAQVGVADLELVLESRLDELDYGLWSGRTRDDIIEQFGHEELSRWEEKSIWPTDAGWPGTEQEIKEQVQSLVEDLRARYTGDEVVLIISSNGRLRYFLNAVPGEFEDRTKIGTFKTRTGAISLLELTEVERRVLFWDRRPEEVGSLES